MTLQVPEQLWERERKTESERKTGRRERGRENVSVPAVERNTNAEKRDARGGRPMSTTKAIVRHLLNSSSLPRFHPAISSAKGERGRKRESYARHPM